MRFGLTELIIAITLSGYVVLPVAFIVIGVLTYRRMKRIEERIRKLEQKISQKA